MYDDRNPPPPTDDQAPPEFLGGNFSGPGKSSGASINAKYHELEVFIKAESDKALMCTDGKPGEDGTFEEWFPKSQLRTEDGKELMAFVMDWRNSYKTLQFSEWILQKKGVPGF